VFPDNEVRKGQLTMELKKLRETQEKLTWPSDNSDLPIISWDSCKCSSFSPLYFFVVTDGFFISLVQEQSQKRPLVLVSGFIHDVGSFVNEHPGGPHLLIKMIGKDATTAFFGGVYDHSNAAHNVSPFLAHIF
jgi:stearoyl-CoA desaturase (Delta-9 desaturase)